jgi:ubiquitin carboxyl-terminal hydrolase 5/13
MYLYCVSGYPLAVKLGTITKDEKADVYSYDEDSMVEDKNLIAHLAHFGINIAQMEKVKEQGIVSSSKCLLFGVMKLIISK